MDSSTDRIVRQIVLKASRARVWQALTNAQEFGAWFGVQLEGQAFSAGQSVHGRIVIPGFEHVIFQVTIERMEPERRFAWRWHPYAVDPAVDYSQEPTTLVDFELTDVAEGTLLRVVESGFDALPPQRRLEAFRMNSGGWDAQLKNIAKHVEAS